MSNRSDFTNRNTVFTGTAGIVLPKGTTGQRPGGAVGQVRFNTELAALENYTPDGWFPVSVPIPNVAAVTGTVFAGQTSLLTLSGTNFGVEVGSVRFTVGGAVISVTVVPTSATAATVIVPAAVFNASAGSTVNIQFVNSDNGVSNVIARTVTALPTGGTIETIEGFRVHTFTSSSSLVVPAGFSATAEYLVVAGGGGGSRSNFATGGGAGGAGGYRSSVVGESSGGNASAESTISLLIGSYVITVGAGGANQTNGVNSVFGTITSIGGGRGAGYNQNSASSGGSGGGGAYNAQPGASGTSGQGTAGGNSTIGGGGGGGGAGGAGGNSPTDNRGGTGGVGISSSITGTSVARAGGGGGGTTNYYTSGAINSTATAGGGAGNSNGNGFSGTANTGGGGGGPTGDNEGSIGGTGGSGIVIVRYPIDDGLPTGGAVTTVGEYRVHEFTTSGSFAVPSEFEPLEVEYLVVAGGGSGGLPYGGGGGAGGQLTNVGSPMSIDAQSYPVIVGAGGPSRLRTVGAAQAGADGNGSSVFGLTAVGGGGGGCWDGATAPSITAIMPGRNGGSGGGGGNFNVGDSEDTVAGGTGVTGQGFDGGLGRVYNQGGGGGGGGSGQVGGPTVFSTLPGNGGDGAIVNIDGLNIRRGGGGGGGDQSLGPGAGGLGGGGNGANGSSQNGGTGAVNTGSGGGAAGGSGQGANANTMGNSGAGGSGIVIIRYIL